MANWQVQQAKARFSEVLSDAETKGPQIITRHGSEQAVVISIAEYRKLTDAKPKNDLIHFLLHEGPKFDDDVFENLRDPNDFGREIEL